MKLRTMMAIGGAVALVLGLVGTPHLESDAAWADAVQARVVVQAGEWGDPEPGFGAVECYPADPTVTAECTITPSWTFWGAGYRVSFGVESTSPVAFMWEARFDLSKEYQDANGNPLLSQGVAMFPGLTVPYQGGDWHVTGLQQHENFCAVSDASEWPVMRVRGIAAWNRNVGGTSPTVPLTQGFQVAPGSTGYPAPC